MFAGDGTKRPMRLALLAGVSDLDLGYGRFMQTDPLGYGDGLNWYSYVGGDPVNAADPSGMAEVGAQKPHIYCTDDCTGSRIPGNVSASNFGFTGFSKGGVAYYGGGGGGSLSVSAGNCSSECPEEPGIWHRDGNASNWGSWLKIGDAPTFGGLLSQISSGSLNVERATIFFRVSQQGKEDIFRPLAALPIGARAILVVRFRRMVPTENARKPSFFSGREGLIRRVLTTS